jgi:hypothetical protein
VERCDILVEVNGEEVEASGTGLDGGLIVLQDVVKIIRGFGGNGPDLFVAPGVAGNEQDRDSPDLRGG